MVLIHNRTPHNVRALLHPAPPCPSGSTACAHSLTGHSCSIPEWYLSSLDRFSQAPKQTYLALFTFMPLSRLDLCSPAIPTASLFGLQDLKHAGFQVFLVSSIPQMLFHVVVSTLTTGPLALNKPRWPLPHTWIPYLQAYLVAKLPSNPKSILGVLPGSLRDMQGVTAACPLSHVLSWGDSAFWFCSRAERGSSLHGLLFTLVFFLRFCYLN